MTDRFAQLGVHSAIIEQLYKHKLMSPTDIQLQAIPYILQGKDLQVSSQTGTGKTLTYLIPILQMIRQDLKKLQAVVLVPTQELAMQVLRVAERYGNPLGITAQALIGGASTKRQLLKLKLHPQLVVATPGRLLELLKSRKIHLQAVQTIVVDEADRMFELGSEGWVDDIIRRALRSRQLLFFSATLTDSVRKLADERMNDPIRIQIAPQHKVSQTLEHWYFVCDERDKIDLLRRLLRHLQPKSAIIFANETDPLSEITEKLRFHGLHAASLYSEAGKLVRAETMRAFREGRLPFLVTTDLAARGIDVEELSHIFLIDIPPDANHYVHRAGRAGRMGKPGTVISFITPDQRSLPGQLMKKLQITMQEMRLSRGKVSAIYPRTPSKK